MTYGFSYAPYNDLQAFKDACTENTIAIMVEPVLIDEVQTGWCRAGAVMSYMNYGIKQDIVALYYKAL